MALILHRFKEVRTSILTLIFEDRGPSTNYCLDCAGPYRLGPSADPAKQIKSQGTRWCIGI